MAVKVTYKEGSLGRAVIRPGRRDDVAALVIYAGAKLGDMNLDEVHKFKSAREMFDRLTDSQQKTPPNAYKEVENYFRYNNTGRTLYVVMTTKGLGDLVKLDSGKLASDIFSSTDPKKNLLVATENQLNMVGFCLQDKSKIFADKGAGFSLELKGKLKDAQDTAELISAQSNPVSFIFSTPSWMANASKTGALSPGLISELPDWRTGTDNYHRCSILLGSYDDQETSVGYVIGRLSSTQVQVNIGKVSDGKIPTPDDSKSWMFPFPTKEKIEGYESSWQTIMDQGYIIPVKLKGKAGWYFSDDPVLTPANNDRKYIALNRVVDKASDLTFLRYQDELKGEVEVDPKTGKLAASTVAYLETIVEQTIQDKMVTNSELIAVKAFVDPNQDIVSQDDTINVELSLVAYGYYRSINVSLGLTKSI